MKVIPSLHESYELRLRAGILIYADGSEANGYRERSNRVSCVATMHAIETGPDHLPQFREGRTVTPEDVNDLIKALARNKTSTRWLPPHVIASSSGALTWWKPGCRRRIWFKTGQPDLDTLNGKLVSHPALLFRCDGHGLDVMALAINERPLPATPLFHAPYLNVMGNDGGVQLCGCRPPKTVNTDNLEAWEAVFYDSAFSHGETRAVCKGGSLALWTAMQTAKRFDTSLLLPTKQTVKSFLA